jgi:uncharacterized protein YbjT (DUF2867 family)
MKRILITGATGNVGQEVIRFLYQQPAIGQVVAGVRNIADAKRRFSGYEKLDFVAFDFENPASFDDAFRSIDAVFLLRPPHISDIDRYFKPLVEAMVKHRIRELVFLSVQGVEKSSVIPHNKIEKLISGSGIPYFFLRPSYFMQNLTTTLLPDIQHKRKIILPAGKAKFNWIDIENIGEVVAIVLENFGQYQNRALELTGYENLNFYEVVELINARINSPIQFSNTNPFRFYHIKKSENMPKGMILVMIMLHFLPRFQKEPQISGLYEQLTGRKPTQLDEFIRREQLKFETSISLAN